MRFSFHSKLALILAVAAVQAVCLSWGVFVFDAWLERSIRGTVHKQVLDDNLQTAKQMAKLIRAMGVEDPRTDLASWNRLQSTVAGISLPNDGFVCLTDAGDGRVLCHPRLKARPVFAQGTAAGRVTVNSGASAGGVPSSEALSGGQSGGRVSGGVVQTSEGLQIVAAAELPEINARVLVHQLGRGIDAAIARVVEPVRPIGLAVSLGLVALTTVGVASVVRKHENQLEAINRNLEGLVERRTNSLMKTRNGLIFGLAKLAESRDTDTGEHLERIAKYVSILARQLQENGVPLSDADIEQLALASSLHDIGKVGVPDAVLLKPGRLDPDERAVIETHAAIGGDCLRALSERLGDDDFLQAAEEIAYGHHEKWDGTGYPFQRSGEQIPLSARIVAVADVYDALRSKRPYKDGMPHEKARAILVADSGSHFDPVVVEAFLATEESFRAVQPEPQVVPPEVLAAEGQAEPVLV
ncbi:MAG: HD domain-containing phosphohydrolase [Planctomycetota bacterium]